MRAAAAKARDEERAAWRKESEAKEKRKSQAKDARAAKRARDDAAIEEEIADLRRAHRSRD